MERSEKHSSSISPEQAKAIANSEAGKQLYERLQKEHSQQLHNALASVQAGDQQRIKESLSQLLSIPELQKLISQLGGSSHG